INGRHNKKRRHPFQTPSLKGLEAKPPPLWVLTPFNAIYERGLKPTEEPAKPEQSSIRLLKQTAKESLRHKTQPRLSAH
ncbi:hypothetical protein, partial [uncultured Parabacteroides sp.]|uniref:hypothetical protein n=1 Tax=uncultured Parabacteroides sp. TaxID=512312 RepID=UPI0025F1DC6C